MHGFIRQYAAGAFDPEAVLILTGAFDDAWASLQASAAPSANEEYAAAARTILAKRIIVLAKEGQLDRRRLTIAALVHLARQKLGKTPTDDLT
jgi:shikimate kinase